MTDDLGAEPAVDSPLVRIVIETNDLGDKPAEIAEFIRQWLDTTIEAAPFHVEGAGFEVIVRSERMDV